jgi:hypothetical protein
MKSVIGLVGLAVTIASASLNAATVTLEHQVSAVENLYYTDWGHWWYGPTDGDKQVPNNTDGALNDGAAAKYVSFNGQPFSFDYSQVKSVNISVTGSVRDFSNTVYTDANGCATPSVCREAEDPIYKGLPVYSLIGLWSTTADYITPVKFDSNGKGYAFGDLGYDDEEFYSTTASPFFIGTNLTIDFASIMPASAQHLYLFMAENDGAFSDNFAEDHYSATITVTTSDVPVPPAAFLLGSGLLGLLGVRSRRTR